MALSAPVAAVGAGAVAGGIVAGVVVLGLAGVAGVAIYRYCQQQKTDEGTIPLTEFEGI